MVFRRKAMLDATESLMSRERHPAPRQRRRVARRSQRPVVEPGAARAAKR